MTIFLGEAGVAITKSFFNNIGEAENHSRKNENAALRLRMHLSLLHYACFSLILLLSLYLLGRWDI